VFLLKSLWSDSIKDVTIGSEPQTSWTFLMLFGLSNRPERVRTEDLGQYAAKRFIMDMASNVD